MNFKHIVRLSAVMAIGSLIWLSSSIQADEIGSVDTKFSWTGPDDKIVVEAFEDPDVDGVACYLSRAKTGGLKGAIGLAEDTSDASIACRQIGPIELDSDIVKGKRDGDTVFKKRWL
jgi:CreA protein